MEIGEHYALPLLKKKWIRTNITMKVWYHDSLGRPKLDYINRYKIKDMHIKATVYKIHRTYVEFKLENNKIIYLKNEQASKLEKFL